MRMVIVAGLALTLAACGGSGGAKPPQAMPIPKDRPSTTTPPPAAKIERRGPDRGLGDVLGKGVADLKRMFGEPRIDVVEVYGRKLQFAGKPCILDAYLYPDGKNGAEIVTHIDARRSDGAEVDRAACVNALMRR
jgi:hypothetical protein